VTIPRKSSARRRRPRSAFPSFKCEFLVPQFRSKIGLHALSQLGRKHRTPFGANRVLTRRSERLFDHLVGAGEHCRRHGKAERLRGFEVEHQLELDRGLDRKLARLLTFEDAVDVAGPACVLERLPKALACLVPSCFVSRE
jgi:hypothetical protein